MPSWEERSLLGFVKDTESIKIDKVVMLQYSISKFESKVESTIAEIEKICSQRNIQFSSIQLISDDYIKIWQELQVCVNSLPPESSIYFDITTMPRNIIWVLLFFLKQRWDKINYTYHSPEKYANEWISREPDTPRLLIKHSGIIDLGKHTALLIVTGFDPDRTRQLIDFYEPKYVYLLIQEGNQFDNESRNNTALHEQVCREEQVECSSILINTYTQDFGLDVISSIIGGASEYNLICTSLGPKLSALSLYQCSFKHPDMALCYIPCKEYNLNYCSGIGKTHSGVLSLK